MIQYLFLTMFALPLVLLVIQGITYPILKLRLGAWFLKGYFYFATVTALGISLTLFVLNDWGNSVNILGVYSVANTFQNNILMFFSLLLFFLVGVFSFEYLNREIGFNKFHLNFNLFWLGILLMVWSTDTIMMYVGWEFIGITSIFLISFYSYRYRPIKSSLFAMVFYKVADLFLILSLITLKHPGASASIKEDALIGIIIAGLIKAGAFPFTSWLSRAIEGPTQSSAIYYTSLAVNVGLILLIKFYPILASDSILLILLVVMGVLTVIYSSLVGSVQSNAKSSLVYSSSVQTGVILIEIGLGYTNFAIFHMFSSSFFKAYQFLRAPSYIRLFHNMEYGKVVETTTGPHILAKIIPAFIRHRIYQLAYRHFYLDALMIFIGRMANRIGRVVRDIFYPVITYKATGGYRIMNWLLYFLLVIYLVDIKIIEIHQSYFKILPILMFMSSLLLLTSGSVYQFIASFIIFKTIEFFFTNTLKVDVSYGYTVYVFAALFISFLTYYNFTKIKRGELAKEVFLKSMIITFMLTFANLPFVLMSESYEHLLGFLFEENDYINLFLYGLANTVFNIGIYSFIFGYVYLTPKEKVC